jgi:hypothetical protein
MSLSEILYLTVRILKPSMSQAGILYAHSNIPLAKSGILQNLVHIDLGIVGKSIRDLHVRRIFNFFLGGGIFMQRHCSTCSCTD